jgi:cobalt-zinc-cadmium efflux system protein
MSHSHAHHHHKESELSGRNLLLAILLNGIITFAEIVGGLLSHSLSLISDALHNFSDTISLFIAWIANIAGRKESNARKTFGFKRIEILAAFFNAVVLVVVCIYLLVEAWKRFQSPQLIQGRIMIFVALVGLAGNLGGMLLLRKDSGRNLNIRAAYMHLLGDTLSSVAVVAGGLLIYFFNLYWIDPVLTILISLYILRETYGVLKQAIDILMQSTPAGLDLEEVRKAMEALPGISNVHHAHAWNLTDQELHFECHIDLVDDIRLSETTAIQSRVERMLKSRFGIGHITIQFEFDCCGDKRYISH